VVAGQEHAGGGGCFAGHQPLAAAQQWSVEEAGIVGAKKRNQKELYMSITWLVFISVAKLIISSTYSVH
jgi:hypothetical protein